MRKIVLLSFLFIGAFQTILAQTKTWNGSVNTDWFNPNNWTPAGVPLATEDVIINNGTLPNQPILNANTTVTSITMSGNSTLTINGATLTVSGSKNSSFVNSTVTSVIGGTISFNIASGNSLTFGSNFTCNVDITGQAGRIFFNGSTFNAPISLMKTGTIAYSNGGNTFNSPITLTNASNTIWRLANLTPDNFNAPCTFINTGTSQLQIAFTGTTTITADFTFQSTAGVISVGSANANVTLNNNIDLTTVVSSTARFQNCTFNQNPLILTLGTNGTFQTISSTFSNDFNLTTGRFLSQSSTFNGNFVLIRNNNSVADNSFGGNTFNGDVDIVLDGTVGGRFANNLGDTFNGMVNIINNSTANFTFAFTGTNFFNSDLNITNNTSSVLTFGNTGNLTISGPTYALNNTTGTIRFSQATGCTVNFNDNISFDNPGGGSFRFGNGGGVSHWNNGVLLSISNFNNGGTLQLNYVNQIDGSLTQNITLPTGTLIINGCTWNAFIDFKAPSITSANSIYNNTTILEKTGAGTNSFYGNNTFNGNTQIINSGTGTLRMANTIGDDFNSNVTFVRSSGVLVPVYNAISTFAGDVTVTSTTTINFNGTASSVAVFDGNTPQYLSASSGINRFTNVQINGSSTEVILNNLMEIITTGSLQFTNGIINLNNNILRILNPAGSAVTRTLGGIISESPTHAGRVEWSIGTNTDIHEFPFINNSNEYVPFIVTLNSGNLGIVQASTYGTPANNLPYPLGVTALLNNSAQNNSLYTVDRFYLIIPSGSTYNANATFSYGDSEILAPNTIDENYLKAQRWNGTLWEAPVGNVNTALNRVDVTGITVFSPWTIADASEPLPVQFMNFDAKVNGLVVDLTWTTANERNNNYFSVERSLDAVNFESIGKVNGSGNTNTHRTYQYADFNPYKGVSYYRIRQVDFDGSETFSQIRTVRFDQLIGWISYYPNPASHQLTFNLTQTNALDIEVTILNSAGQTVWKNHLKPQQYSEYNLDISEWTAGLYLVNVKIEGKTTTSKLVVQ